MAPIAKDYTREVGLTETAPHLSLRETSCRHWAAVAATQICPSLPPLL